MPKSDKTSANKNKKDYVEFRLPKLNLKDKPNNGIVVLLVVFAFIIGVLTNRVILLEKDVKDAKSEQATTTTQQPNELAPEETGPVDVSVDDDPVLGDPNAPLTMIEFSDYECPFCKRYFDETYGQIKKEYVDTGKLKIVFRDFPLSFHDPLATLEAVAANCARAQADDAKYFEYHDEIFKRTTSNGNGLTEEDLGTIATDLGLNISTFNICLADETNKEEVAKDVADGQAAGASGTPSFFIGKTTKNGIISGTKLVGAYPFSSFQEIIEKELSK